MRHAPDPTVFPAPTRVSLLHMAPLRNEQGQASDNASCGYAPLALRLGTWPLSPHTTQCRQPVKYLLRISLVFNFDSFHLPKY
jgi:hypothetical protein